MEHEPQIIFQADGNPFADATQRPDFLSLGG